MKVLKFGGSSVATSASIQKVIQIVKEAANTTNVAVVVSAFGGVTDLLLSVGIQACNGDENYKETFDQIEQRHLDIIRSLIPAQHQSSVLGQVKKMLNSLESNLEGVFLIREISDRSSDRIVSYGELLSSFIIAEAMKHHGLDAIRKASQELIITDQSFSNAKVKLDKTAENIETFFKEDSHAIVILPGFVASTESNDISTLGRGGSDYSAALIAAAANASVLEIWTDVSGMYTANPSLVKQAVPIKQLSYQEAMELSHFGAKVLYPPTIQPVLEKEIPVLIKNTFNTQDHGTLITKVTANKNPIKGISHMQNLSLLTLEGSGMVGIPGFSARLFAALAKAHINVALITQASSEHSICVAIESGDANQAQQVVEEEFAYELSQHSIDPLAIEHDNAIVALVGDNMKNHQGISGKMFSTLGRNNVNIRAIAQGASEKNISAVIAHRDIKKALNTLHSEFFEGQTKQLNLFVVGVGNVGNRFIEMIKSQSDYMVEQLNLQVRVVGLANSRKMCFAEDGLDLDIWQEQLEQGETLNMINFHRKVTELNYRNSIFIDNTASETVAQEYESYLKESVAVVTCNKIACSSTYATYQELKALSREYHAPFLFETNVGAGLPVIDTLKNLITSGDKVQKIQAVLSGSLNYIFNNYNGKRTFGTIVADAGVEGYTEPDPRIDLSGVDVMRKILILARESGLYMELDDIENKSFLPEACERTETVADFMTTLEQHEAHFQQLYEIANSTSTKLKYVATLDKGKAAVGIEGVPVDHPFYNLDGKDNIVLFYTDRYKEQPLIIKGAGAGADVTASGIFADIIRIGNTA